MSTPKVAIATFKEGFEHTQFKTYKVREMLVKLLDNIQADMDDVGFEFSPETQDVLKEAEDLWLELSIKDAPRPRKNERGPLVAANEEIEFRKQIESRRDADEEIEERPGKRKYIDDIVDE